MEITLLPEAEGPAYRRLFETLRTAIATGSLAAGERLPATRELASRISLSRNTVNTAYDMLHAEGYVLARPGSGYYVAEALPDQATLAWRDDVSNRKPTRRGLSQRGRFLSQASRPVPVAARPAFQRGLPALDQFPFRLWQQHLARHCRRPDAQLLRYRDDGGLPELRSALRDYLNLARGVRCEADQLIVVKGGQAALDLVTRMLVDEGDKVAIEEPGYPGARDALLAAGAALLPTPVDQEGLRVEYLTPAARLVYVTPSYQFPLGVTLSAARRMELLHWATMHDAYIIEDDYDSEFRYSGRPLSCMQGLDTGERVIYVGTFSKVMFPALRLGYIVVPRHLRDAFANALRKTGQDAPSLLQAVAADFIRSGQLASHIRRMRGLYASRQQSFVQLAGKHLASMLDVQPTHAGMQLACRFKVDIDEQQLRRRAADRGLDIACLSAYYMEACDAPGLLLGYAGIPQEAMEAAILELREILLASLRPAAGLQDARSGPPTAGGS